MAVVTDNTLAVIDACGTGNQFVCHQL